LVVFTFLLYIFDVEYWKSSVGKFIRRSLYGFVVIGTSSLVLAISGEHPYGPISIYLVLTTLWLVSVHKMFFIKVENIQYVTWLTGPLFCTSMLIFLAWFIWTFWKPEHEWTISIKLIDAGVTGCEPDFTDHENCRGENKTEVCFTPNGSASVYFPQGCDLTCGSVYSNCLNTFIIWSGPFLVSAGLLFLSFFTSFVGGQDSAEDEIAKFAKIWLLLLFGMWVSASLAGAGGGFTVALAAITLAAFVASGVFLAISYKRIEREEKIRDLWKILLEKYGTYLDVIRGLLIVTCAPVAVLYIFVSGLKQRIRSMKFKCATPPEFSTRTLTTNRITWLTVEGRTLLKEFYSWDRANVYSLAVYWGVAFITLIFVSRFTILFLSWLINETMDMSLGVVTCIMVGAGVLMFLLPPVPGAPIYLTMGIIVIPVGSANLGLVWSIVYAIGISLLLKLLATALQQKMIGGLLQNQVGIRQLVGVNTDLIKAMKLLLEDPGIGLPKVSILCGGPDWPTSVLCGIMDLSLLPILIGTLPVITLVVPTVLTGSFIYMAQMQDDSGSPLYAWAEVGATLNAAIAAIFLFGNMGLAAYYVERTISSRADELAKIEIDQEVKDKDDAEESFRLAYTEVTNWEVVPFVMKTTLFLAVMCMIISCYTVQLFQLDCFVPYQLTDTIEEELGGNWKNLVKPVGCVSLLLFTISVILFLAFYQWAKTKATAKCEADETTNEAGETTNEAGKTTNEAGETTN